MHLYDVEAHSLKRHFIYQNQLRQIVLKKMNEENTEENNEKNGLENQKDGSSGENHEKKVSKVSILFS